MRRGCAWPGWARATTTSTTCCSALRPRPGAAPSEPARFALFNLRLADGQFSFDDRPVGRTHVLRKLTLDLPFLSNLPDHLQVKVEPRLAFELNGTAFDNQGQATPFAEGRASEFKIRFDPLDLTPMWAYVPATLPVQPGRRPARRRPDAALRAAA